MTSLFDILKKFYIDSFVNMYVYNLIFSRSARPPVKKISDRKNFGRLVQSNSASPDLTGIMLNITAVPLLVIIFCILIYQRNSYHQFKFIK